MDTPEPTFPIHRRHPIRQVMRFLCKAALGILTDLHIEGRENLPASGPLLLVGNHFSFIDPLTFVRIAPWPMEFLGGFNNPSAPPVVKIIPALWGYLPLFRGTGARDSLRTAEIILNQGGVIGIFPEGGNWATVLRPARPGTAMLAVRTGARILPVGIDGLLDVFSSLRKGRRARVTFRIGQPFGPFTAEGAGRERRRQLDEIGHEIMRHVAELIPEERRGHYASDPAIRAAAAGTEIYPWATKTEREFKTGEFLE